MLIIIHIDMDAYFASVEQQANPALRGQPIVVSGRPDIHSVVAAASREAKTYGIRAGMSTWEARKLCPHLTFVPGDPDKYETITRRFLDVLVDYTPMVEVYSIDEVFMDVTQEADRHGGALCLAREIQRRLRATLGEWIPCSIGIAPSKLLAKLAVEKAKPAGVHRICPQDVPQVLARTPVEDVCGIGPRIARRLSHMGIWNLADLSRYPEGYLRARFGVYGAVLAMWGRGLDPSPLIPYWQEGELKSVGHSHAVPKALRDPEGARSVLLYLCERTGRRLRAKGLAGRVVHLDLRDANMHHRGGQRALEVPTDDEEIIFQTALDLVRSHGGFPGQTTMVGVRVGSVISGKEAPRPLLPEQRRRERLEHAMDHIRNRYGESALWRGSVYACRVLTQATGGMGRQKEIAQDRQADDRRS